MCVAEIFDIVALRKSNAEILVREAREKVTNILSANSVDTPATSPVDAGQKPLRVNSEWCQILPEFSVPLKEAMFRVEHSISHPC